MTTDLVSAASGVLTGGVMAGGVMAGGVATEGVMGGPAGFPP